MRKTLLFLLLGFCIVIPVFPVNSVSAGQYTYIQNGLVSATVDFNADNDIKCIQHLSAYNNRITDYANGYAISYPNDMWVDASLSKVKTCIANDHTQIEIYRDDFTNTVHNSKGYINYSNRAIKAPENTIQMDKNIVINGVKVHVLQWSRAALSAINNDKNYYLSAEYRPSNTLVYTVMIKSQQPVDQFMGVINSFELVPIQGQARINKSFLPAEKTFNEETTAFYKKYFGPEAGQSWGIFENSALYDISYLNSLEKRLNYNFDFLVWYKSLGTEFPQQELEMAYNNHKYVELTMQYPLNTNLSYAILNGQYDSYLRDYAIKLKNFKHPVLFRLNNEMNGDWCSYSSLYTSKDTELYKAVWRHTYNIFQAAGVDNAVWIWNPNDASFPGFQWNHALNYFPGEAYVDIIGLTGYNTGNYYPGEIWREFNSIYQPLYDEYNRTFHYYPFMITEFGCNSVGGDKNQWIQQMFNSMPSYPKIKVAIWFNGTDLDANGQPARIYRLDDTESSLQTFKAGLSK